WVTVRRVLRVLGGCSLLSSAVSSYAAGGEGPWGRGLALTFGPVLIVVGLWGLLGPRRPARPPDPPPARAEWAVREPINRSDQVPHEEYVFARREGPWRLLAASVRGKYHAHTALWRDDSFAWGSAGPWTVLA